MLALWALAACSRQEAPEEGAVSAAVVTVPPRQGSLPERVTAYGTAGPSQDALRVLNVQAAGHVAHWDVAVGAPVRRGQRLLTFALAPSAVAAYQQATSALALAVAQRAHAAALYAQQLATRDQLDQAGKVLRDAQSNLDALARQQGRAATVEVDAPFDGSVAAIDAAPGDALASGAPLLSVQRGDGLVVTVGIERESVARVMAGAEVELTPLDAGPAMRGTVRRVARVLDAHTHQVDVEVVPDGAPLAGEGFRAEIVVGQWQGWLLPRDAVQGDEGSRYVFQLADGKAVRVPVRVLGESERVSVAAGALDSHRPLVTEGASQLDDGMAVRAAGAADRP
ncbi:efflux RND transporter periplasmic adaptor subunit [Dyella sedimenti]|uniref:efflux RND transporter periplasmic adaptor subunit n=1 Tax=Dyella sedimenti TaxID=2919947 RepID=UPI001FA9A21F|nr:efflux RND transporter periplasmic adaptor subunit [Dyella sedimenti]